MRVGRKGVSLLGESLSVSVSMSASLNAGFILVSSVVNDDEYMNYKRMKLLHVERTPVANNKHILYSV